MTEGRRVEMRLASDAVLAVAEPVQLIGTGSLLEGELIVSGDGPRSIRLHPSLVLPEDGEEITFRARPVIFRPCTQRSVRVWVDVSPPLGPGRRAAELRLGESAIAVEVLVAESRDLTVLPNPVTVPNQPGAAITVEVVCRNDGNVPAFVGSIGPVQVAGGRGFRRFRDRSDERDQDETEPPAFLEIDVLGDQEWVQPGRTESLRWAVTVPDGLAAGVLYGGAAPLSSTPVNFLVIPTFSASRQQRGERQPRASGPARGGPRQRASRSAAAGSAKAKETPST
jgi:hypothetical protein